jgi:hypothetical protein
MSASDANLAGLRNTWAQSVRSVIGGMLNDDPDRAERLLLEQLARVRTHRRSSG